MVEQDFLDLAELAELGGGEEVEEVTAHALDVQRGGGFERARTPRR